MSTLGFALLGLLAHEPATGYELARQLRQPVGYFWHARHSQIYPTLADLEENALVTHEVIDGPGPRPTKRYRITRSGRAAVRAWLRSTTPEVDEREVLLRVYLVWLLPPRDATTMLSAIKQYHQRSLQHYLDTTGLRPPAPTPPPRHPLFGDRVTLEWGIEFERRRIAWIERVINHIQTSEGDSPTE